MSQRDQILSILHEAMKSSPADQTELVFDGEAFSLTHVAESQIQQNMMSDDCSIVARTVIGKKIGIASTNRLTIEDVRKAISDAVDISTFQDDDEDFVSLPKSPKAPEVSALFESTANFSPVDRANAVWQMNKIAAMHNLKTAGAFKTVTNRVAVINSLGTEQYFEGTSAELSLTVSGETGASGYGIAYNRDVSKINPGAVAETAVDKAVRTVDPISLPSGSYTVLLEPAAVGQLLLFLAFMGFGSKTFVQHRSFMAGKIGTPIAGGNFSVRDEAYNSQMLGMPFDYEGVPRKEVALITNGVAKGVVSNSYDANLLGEGVESTGHAHIATRSFTPYPKHMVMKGGDVTVDEMIRSVDRGMYITHFWYVNYLNPMKTMVTGTTRDGTFLIENGEVTNAIVNMRMQQSILEAFSNCRMLSKERVLYPQYSVVMLVPYALVDNFQLTEEAS
ncbi:MAG: TldD/PmbA family protein [Candidatus Zixiibacteriota bacterium]